MSSTSDPVEAKRVSREAWGQAALGWDKWSTEFERGAGPVNDALVQLADVSAGSKVLDIACGIGATSAVAAKAAGPTGSVLGTDIADQMIEIARRRAHERGSKNVTFRVHDAEVACDGGPFDAAVSRFGVMLVPEPQRAARAVFDVLRPGARFAAAVWGRAEEVPFLALAQQIAVREFGIPPPEKDAPGPLRLGRPGALEDVLRDAGFTSVDGRVLTIDMQFASPADFRRFLSEMSASLKHATESLSASEQARFWTLVERASDRFVSNGAVHLPSIVRCAVGVRPR